MSKDARLQAFLSDGPEIFNSVQQGQTLWKRDPFDVPSINAPARAAFERLVKRATAQTPPEDGRILLLKGDSGSGKTHLVRAFRNSVHESGKGYVGYLPMTVDVTHYDRYILSEVIDSLEKPYDHGHVDDSGLMLLSEAVLKRCKNIFAANIPEEDLLDDEELHGNIRAVADDLHADPEFRNIDVNLLRALLCLQRREARFHHRIVQWLRCEEMSPEDRAIIGNLVPRTTEESPSRMLIQLGQLMGIFGKALVLCVDQVEDMLDFEQKPQMEPSFRRAMSTLVALAAQVPSAIVVVCCLSDFWTATRSKLNRAMLDRIERNPEPVDLELNVTAQTARDIAARRLKALYEQQNIAFNPAQPTYPIPSQGFDLLSGQRPRDILNACHRYREQGIQDSKLPAAFPLPEKKQSPAKGSTVPPQMPPAPDLDQAWTDFKANFKARVPEGNADLAALLAWGIQVSAEELGDTNRFKVSHRDDDTLDVTAQPGDAKLHVVICNKSPGGGHLGRQMASALRAAARSLPVLVRTTEFPGSLGTLVAEQTAVLQRRGGRRAVVGPSDLRELLALQAFRKQQDETAFLGWSRVARPVTRLQGITDLLALGKHAPSAPVAAPVPVAGKAGALSESAVSDGESEWEVTPAGSILPHKPAKSAPALIKDEGPKESKKDEGPKGQMRVGVSEGVFANTVHVRPDELNQHSAFLGGPGSGKTTLALNLIEQLVIQGVPAILVDRKGDLAAYARDASWEEALDDPMMTERRKLLRERVDVALYTPGRSDGRPLSIPVVPRGLDKLSPEERDQILQQAADALSTMLEYRSSPRDKAAKALLALALRLLVQRPSGKEITLDLIQRFVAAQDMTLVQEAHGLDDKVFTKLAQDLATLRLNAQALLSNTGEKLDMNELLGLGAAKVPGKTRLSIISTKFLGGLHSSLFWVSQLLVEANRWASQHPSPKLQAVLLFDEADIYLPAMGIPATKQPMENLLRRARSAGVGVMLATQSPGDLDYKCRDNVRAWFAGRVKEETALRKLKPMFAEARVDASVRLPAQKTGQFHVLREGQVEQLKADRNIIKTEQLSEEEILQLAHRSGEQGIRNAG
ncbi:type IV secretion system DNA-binding domain-containing protein [Corallococcus sp. 4LFB]|uniref:ATP-binding protein n=1 Tax=Corallococcus sp. 4LFB TaxID=3383249 RepID=UPI00397706F5